MEKFSKNELEIISETDFKKQKAELEKELEAFDNGDSDLMDIDEYDSYLERMLSI